MSKKVFIFTTSSCPLDSSSLIYAVELGHFGRVVWLFTCGLVFCIFVHHHNKRPYNFTKFATTGKNLSLKMEGRILSWIREFHAKTRMTPENLCTMVWIIFAVIDVSAFYLPVTTSFLIFLGKAPSSMSGPITASSVPNSLSIPSKINIMKKSIAHSGDTSKFKRASENAMKAKPGPLPT